MGLRRFALLIVVFSSLGPIAPARRVAAAGPAQPRYEEGNKLVLPEGYRSWIFAGASIGLSYSENARTDGPGRFHHIYLQPEAYDEYRRTGRFPEKTMLVMEVHEPAQKVSINRQGYFEGERVGLE